MTKKLDVLEAIDSALESEDYERALLLASKAVREHPDDAALQAAYGDALWALEDLDDAREAFRTALDLDPEEPDSWVALAQLHFQLLDFEDAKRAARRCIDLDPCADAYDVLSRVAEREGDYGRADELTRRAHALDPEYPIPVRVDSAEFERLVSAALEDIPERFQEALDGEVAILVEAIPADELLRSEKPPLDPELLGLYVGTPLPDRDSPTQMSALPDRIYLFQRNLERIAADREELTEQIRITLFHEVGHYFGFSDEELEERDFG